MSQKNKGKHWVKVPEQEFDNGHWEFPAYLLNSETIGTAWDQFHLQCHVL